LVVAKLLTDYSADPLDLVLLLRAKALKLAPLENTLDEVLIVLEQQGNEILEVLGGIDTPSQDFLGTKSDKLLPDIVEHVNIGENFSEVLVLKIVSKALNLTKSGKLNHKYLDVPADICGTATLLLFTDLLLISLHDLIFSLLLLERLDASLGEVLLSFGHVFNKDTVILEDQLDLVA